MPKLTNRKKLPYSSLKTFVNMFPSNHFSFFKAYIQIFLFYKFIPLIIDTCIWIFLYYERFLFSLVEIMTFNAYLVLNHIVNSPLTVKPWLLCIFVLEQFSSQPSCSRKACLCCHTAVGSWFLTQQPSTLIPLWTVTRLSGDKKDSVFKQISLEQFSGTNQVRELSSLCI